MDIIYYWLIRSLLPSSSLRPLPKLPKGWTDPAIYPPCSVRRQVVCGSWSSLQSKSHQFDKENYKFLVDVNRGVSVQVSSLSHIFCLELHDLDFSGKNCGCWWWWWGGLCEKDKVCYNDWVLRVNLVDGHLI